MAFVQIEITTLCNYECFYCAGRDMTQQHMLWEQFAAILPLLTPQDQTVSLQGEGEPMIHPRFWDMVAAVRSDGRVPYTITNGSLLDEPQRIADAFPQLGISIDTLDADLAKRIGRYKLPKMLAKVDALLAVMSPKRIVVHTVWMGQPLDTLQVWLRERGIEQHIVQPLQSKPDYAARYGPTDPGQWGACTFRCSYLEGPRMRHFSMDGREMPCCFIKDASRFSSRESLREQLDARQVPDACAGCREIFPQAKTTVDRRIHPMTLTTGSPTFWA